MNIQNTQTVSDGKENFDDIGYGFNAKIATFLEHITEFYKQIRVQQERAKYNRKCAIKARQQPDLLPLEEKHQLRIIGNIHN
jgi:hypothetical protein